MTEGLNHQPEVQEASGSNPAREEIFAVSHLISLILNSIRELTPDQKEEVYYNYW